MRQELKNELIRAYGTQIEKSMDIIEEKIAAMICAHLYVGQVGDSPLCALNRAFEEILKK